MHRIDKVDQSTEQRDLAFFFGDGEGAYTANALAQIVRMVRRLTHSEAYNFDGRFLAEWSR